MVSGPSIDPETGGLFLEMTLKTLADRFDEWGPHPRSVPWSVKYRFGYGAASQQRVFRWFAPPDEEGARAVLTRMHNGILFLQPLGVVLEAPVPEDLLTPWLERIRQVHALPISLSEEEEFETLEGESVDIPALELTQAEPIAGLAVGLDIGGTSMKACALEGGVVKHQAQILTWPKGEHGLDSIVGRARALIEEVCQGRSPASLGIGLASPMGVRGQVVSLSTVMRAHLDGVGCLEALPVRVAENLVDGPVAIFNDLANLGRMLSGQGRRRLLRIQIGTSFGGCWVDADGTVSAAELGRLVVDTAAEARPHTYLPLRGAMRSYLSNDGVALSLSEWMDRPIEPEEVGFVWRDLNRAGNPLGRRMAASTSVLLVGAIREALALLPGLEEVELGGGMLQGPSGRLVSAEVEEGLGSLRQRLRFGIAPNPGFDGAIAAAQAPLIDAPLRGVRRLEGGRR